MVSLFVWPARLIYQRLGGFSSSCYHSSGATEFQSKILAGFPFQWRLSLSGLQTAASFLCASLRSASCAFRTNFLVSLPVRTLIPWLTAPLAWPHFPLLNLQKVPAPYKKTFQNIHWALDEHYPLTFWRHFCHHCGHKGFNTRTTLSP